MPTIKALEILRRAAADGQLEQAYVDVFIQVLGAGTDKYRRGLDSVFAVGHVTRATLAASSAPAHAAPAAAAS